LGLFALLLEKFMNGTRIFPQSPCDPFRAFFCERKPAEKMYMRQANDRLS
jgi:hypothetical protein